jgi:hypothetical protein
MDDIEAIRERARVYPGVSKHSPIFSFIEAIEAWDGVGEPPDVPEDANLWRWYHRAAQDRAALLAALDEARATEEQWLDRIDEATSEVNEGYIAAIKERDEARQAEQSWYRGAMEAEAERDAARADADALAEALRRIDDLPAGHYRRNGFASPDPWVRQREVRRIARAALAAHEAQKEGAK